MHLINKGDGAVLFFILFSHFFDLSLSSFKLKCKYFSLRKFVGVLAADVHFKFNPKGNQFKSIAQAIPVDGGIPPPLLLLQLLAKRIINIKMNVDGNFKFQNLIILHHSSQVQKEVG